MKSYLCILTMILIPFCLNARERNSEFTRRLQCGVEWGYTQTYYKYHHYNIVSAEGYRINEESNGFFFHPNGSLLANVGYDLTDRLNLAVYSGYLGLADNCRVFPISLRASIFPHNNMYEDGFFSYIEGGIGFRVPTLEKHDPAYFISAGEAYRIKLTPYCNLDFMLSMRLCFDRPMIANPDGGGYVSRHNIRSNSARYHALSLSIALNF